MIELKGITKRFGKNLAIRNLNFNFNEREFVVIFGPAGAGKSTTLKIIAGIIQPTYGDFFFRGEKFTDIPPEKRNISMVFENYALYSHLTVFENLAFPLRARKWTDQQIKDEVTAMADMLQISSMLDRKPGYLSGGQRQRVALGRGLIRDAYIYLLDEPISHLDARLRIKMRVELKNICTQKQSTVVHVTHDYREAMALADRVIVLNKGEIMQQGRPEDIYHNPTNDFVAKFIGDPPMSFINVGFVDQGKTFGFSLKYVEHVIPIDEDFQLNKNQVTLDSDNLFVGFRANQVTLSSIKNESHQVPGTIYIVEPQGHRNLITVKLGEDLVHVITDPDQRWVVGENTWLSLNAKNLHVFLDGKALYHPVSHLDA